MQRASKSLDELNRYNHGPSNFKANWSFSNLLESTDSNGWAPNGDVEVPQLPIFVLQDSNNSVSLTERFQHKLAASCFEVLEKCSQDDLDEKEKEEAMEKLFYNISSKLEKSVATKLKLPGPDTYYFELIAAFYGHVDNASVVKNKVLPVCGNLWSLEMFPAVYCLIMHRFILKNDNPRKKGGVIRFNVLLKGTNQLFWFDTNHKTHRLLSVFCYIKSKLLTSVTAKSLQNDFKSLLCRFYYYYRSSRIEKVEDFLMEIDTDISRFVLENAYQLEALKTSHLRLHYLSCLARLPCSLFEQSGTRRMDQATRNKFYSTLNAFILPGAPFHPTRDERQRARATMDTLFPNGKNMRYAINSIFHLLRPLYWPMDMVHALTGLWQSMYETLTGSKGKHE